MPAVQTLERFIARVEAHAHVEANEEFYILDSSMRENQGPPRVVRDKHVKAERRVLALARSVHAQCVRPCFVDGDLVDIC